MVGCGNFQLAAGVNPRTTKTQDQQRLDNLECKDKARLAANTTGRQTIYFLLGATLVGAPVAFEMEKSTQRGVYKECMEEKGYQVISPNSTATTEAGLHGKGDKDTTEQLRKLKELHDEGLITSDDYNNKKKEIIDRL
jgi:hypothetical protein